MKNLSFTLLALTSVCSIQPVAAFEKGDIVARVGVANVAPNDSSSNIIVGGDELGFGVGVRDNTQLGLNFAYFLNDRLNIEVLASTPFNHDVDFGVVDPLGTGNQLGEVSHLPPTVTLNYYFNNPSSAFQPYAGIGVNYTIFFDEEFTGANEAAGLNDLSLDNSLGFTAQLGIDYMLNDNWFLNASVRYIQIETDASFNLDGVAGSVGSIDINPTVTTLSLGYLF